MTLLTESFDVEDQLDDTTTVHIELKLNGASDEANRKLAVVIRNTMEAAARIALQKRRALTEENIAALVEIYLEREGIAEVDEDIELDNAELRSNYLKETITYDSAKIHRNSSLESSNLSEPASRWKREKRIFAIRYKGSDRFPAFQFEDGEPKRIIKTILGKLPSDMSPWQIAFWFESGNGWLDGKSPKDVLADRKSVLQAAEREGDLAVG